MRLAAAHAAVVMLLIGGARAGAAQGETADLLRQSRGLYERLEIERALPLLRRLVAPGWPSEISDAQSVVDTSARRSPAGRDPPSASRPERVHSPIDGGPRLDRRRSRRRR